MSSRIRPQKWRPQRLAAEFAKELVGEDDKAANKAARLAVRRLTGVDSSAHINDRLDVIAHEIIHRATNHEGKPVKREERTAPSSIQPDEVIYIIPGSQDA